MEVTKHNSSKNKINSLKNTYSKNIVSMCIPLFSAFLSNDSQKKKIKKKKS